MRIIGEKRCRPSLHVAAEYSRRLFAKVRASTWHCKCFNSFVQCRAILLAWFFRVFSGISRDISRWKLTRGDGYRRRRKPVEYLSDGLATTCIRWPLQLPGKWPSQNALSKRSFNRIWDFLPGSKMAAHPFAFVKYLRVAILPITDRRRHRTISAFSTIYAGVSASLYGVLGTLPSHLIRVTRLNKIHWNILIFANEKFHAHILWWIRTSMRSQTVKCRPAEFIQLALVTRKMTWKDSRILRQLFAQLRNKERSDRRRPYQRFHLIPSCHISPTYPFHDEFTVQFCYWPDVRKTYQTHWKNYCASHITSLYNSAQHVD